MLPAMIDGTMLIPDDRYALIEGDPIRIIDRRNPGRNPLFRIQPHDGGFARKFVRNLNTRREVVASEIGRAVVHDDQP